MMKTEPVHLFVVADDPSVRDPPIDCSFMLAHESAPFLTARCEAPDRLEAAVRSELQDGQRISKLDLHDHGARGIQNMGGIDRTARLVDYVGFGIERIAALKPLLTADAQVRLLGCNTGRDARGRELLLRLRHELGDGRIVFGTLTHVGCWMFGPTGFNDRFSRFLVSSEEVVDGPISSWEDRFDAFSGGVSKAFAVKVQSRLKHIEAQLQNPETYLASCCAR